MNKSVLDDNSEPLLYWVAIKGAAAPYTSLPMPVSVMQKAQVQVGSTPSEPTLWGIASGGEDISVAGMESNYDLLIGYKTSEEQLAAVRTYIGASIEDARDEFVRAIREETVIWGSEKLKKHWQKN
jgi:hypothetical protein